MQRYIIFRLVYSIATLIVVSMVVFVIVRLTGDPILMMLDTASTPAEVERYRAMYGLDQPLHIQYFEWARNAVTGDFGYSFRWRMPVLPLIMQRLPATLELALASLVVAVLIGVPMGIVSALKVGSLTDRLGKAIALAGQSIPSFWLGIMLILIFAVHFRLLPVGGRDGAFSVGLVLPAVTLGVGYTAAAVLRLTRSSMLDVLDSDYIRMARLKGVPERYVILKHALKNAAIPVVTVMGLQMGGILSGAVVTETIFTWPGLGSLLIQSVFSRDYTVVQASVFVTSALFITINFVVDVSYAFLDPRVRLKG